jgi:hypothetical protein
MLLQNNSEANEEQSPMEHSGSNLDVMAICRC